jgi:hypothetical protein
MSESDFFNLGGKTQQKIADWSRQYKCAAKNAFIDSFTHPAEASLKTSVFHHSYWFPSQPLSLQDMTPPLWQLQKTGLQGHLPSLVEWYNNSRRDGGAQLPALSTTSVTAAAKALSSGEADPAEFRKGYS